MELVGWSGAYWFNLILNVYINISVRWSQALDTCTTIYRANKLLFRTNCFVLYICCGLPDCFKAVLCVFASRFRNQLTNHCRVGQMDKIQIDMFAILEL